MNSLCFYKYNIMKGPLKQQKRSVFVTPNTKKFNTSQASVSALHRSLFLHKKSQSKQTYTNNKPITTPQSRGQPILNQYQEFQYQSISQKTITVLNQLNLSALYAYCMRFQEAFKQIMDVTLSKILELELKMAQLMKKFCTIEMRLHQKSKQIKTLISENCVLIELNRDVQIRMEQLRDKYQISCQSVKSQWMANIVDQIKTEIKKYEIQSKICEGCRTGIKEHLTKYLSKIHSLTSQAEKSNQGEQNKNHLQAIKSSLKEVMLLILNISEGKQGIAFQIMKQKSLENIDLKFTVIQFQEKLRQYVRKQQQNLQKKKNEKQMKKESAIKIKVDN